MRFRYQATRDPIWISYGLDVLQVKTAETVTSFQSVAAVGIDVCALLLRRFMMNAGDQTLECHVRVCSHRQLDDGGAQRQAIIHVIAVLHIIYTLIRRPIRMDSYFIAETLKYLFLLFSPDHWVFEHAR
jgi:hypothetical protein